MKKLLDTFVFGLFFTSSFVWYKVDYPSLAFDFRIGYPIIMLMFFLLVLLRPKIVLKVSALSGAIFIVSLISYSLYFRTNFGLIFKQLFGIFLFSTAFFAYMDIRRDNLPKVFRYYLAAAYINAIVVIIQQIGYISHVDFLWRFDWLPAWTDRWGRENIFMRAHGLMAEPSFLAMFLTPSVHLAFIALLNREYRLMKLSQAILIILGMVLTFSSVGYFGLSLSFIIVLLKRFRFSLSLMPKVAILLLGAIFVLSSSENFKSRVASLSGAILRDDIPYEHVSAFTLFANYKIALESFQTTYGLGGGLGSHQNSYYAFIEKFFSIEKIVKESNTEGANSLLLRILSELGLGGVFLALLFIVKNRAQEGSSEIRIINEVCISFFAVYLIRQGHYFHPELWFFISLYYYTNIVGRHEKQNIEKLKRPDQIAVSDELVPVN